MYDELYQDWKKVLEMHLQKVDIEYCICRTKHSR